MKLSIYVSDAMHKRMEKARDTNWSKVAQDAFEQKLGEIAASKPKPDMSDTIDRLRASKAKVQSGVQADGKEAGERWAKEYAEYDELERLSGFRDRNQSWGPGMSFDAFGLAGNIARVAIGDDNFGSRRDIHDFWENLGLKVPDGASEFEFCDGFLEGVENVWNAVQDDL